MDGKLFLYGAGGHCKVVIDIAETLGLEIEAVVDDNPTQDFLYGYPVLTGVTEFDNVIVTIGNCRIRRMITERIKVNHYATLVHPRAIISPHATLGQGCVAMQGAIVQASAKVGNHCIINTKASVGHDCRIGDFVHLASGCTVCGESVIGEGTWIGAGSVIRQGIRIGANCMIGAGSVIVKDIPDGVLAYGNPCRVVRRLETE